MSQSSKIGTSIVVVALIIAGAVIWINKNKTPSQMVDSDKKMSTDQQVSDSSININKKANSEPKTAQEDPAFKAFETTIPTTNWVLWRVTLNNKTADLNVKVPAPLTLQFDTKAKKVSGFAGCNTFSGSYTAGANNKLVLGPIMATELGCSASSLESTILQAMNKVTMYGIKGDQLVLDSADSSTEIVYSQAK